MRQLLTLFGGFAGLAVAALVGFALFTVVGGLIIVAGVVVTALLIGGGLYALITGRGNVTMRRADFGGVRVFDLRTGQEVRPSMEAEMIDITPPKGPKTRPGQR